jgi:uncharacterized protein (DUF1501 family)
MLVVAGVTAPSFITRTALALQQNGTLNTGKILVAVQLTGGNDGLNTLIPFGDAGYYQARSSLALQTSDILPLTDTVGLHPRMGSLKQLYDAGMVAVVQGVGYPNPNRSHFRSMDIWHSARPDTFERTGWLGRYLDACQCGQDRPLPAISAGDTLNSIFYTEHTLVPAVANIGAFSVHTQRTGTRSLDTLKNIYNQAGYWSAHEAVIRKTTLGALDGSAQLQRAAAAYTSPVQYPSNNPLSEQLKMVAQIIAGDLGTHLFSVQIGGFDTHAAQFNQQANLLGQLSDALAAFVSDLEAMGKQDDVLIITFSEFGRRVAQNGSNGTDHGTAEPMFVIGRGVRAGLHGTYPSLEDLDDNGDLKFGTDFREVFASVLQDHLSVDPSPVLAGSFAAVPVLRA